MALALYRKYRPATFAEVVGQEHVTGPLMTAVDSGRINHAYLFSGPRGCGKTSSARILARSLNCEQGPTSGPCGACQSCIDLAPDGSGNIDVIEIDAASHGGVDDARELRERAFQLPVHSRYKIYIIDEAHMVSNQGFNALLKVVEEPPESVVFIFATTEPDKVLPTIRSRTHHYPFRLVPPAAMRDLLERNCASEGVQVGSAVLPLVVRAGGGSVRDSQSLLDQLISGAGSAGITYEEALALLGVTDAALLDDMVEAVGVGDGATVFGTVNRLIDAGHDPRRFGADLLDRLRDLILMSAVPDAGEKGLIDAPVDHVERLAGQASRLGLPTLSRLADIVHAGLTEMRGTTAPRLGLELICARMLLPAASDDAASVTQRVERLERRMEIGGLPAGDSSARTGDGRARTGAERDRGAGSRPGAAAPGHDRPAGAITPRQRAEAEFAARAGSRPEPGTQATPSSPAAAPEGRGVPGEAADEVGGVGVAGHAGEHEVRGAAGEVHRADREIRRAADRTHAATVDEAGSPSAVPSDANAGGAEGGAADPARSPDVAEAGWPAVKAPGSGRVAGAPPVPSPRPSTGSTGQHSDTGVSAPPPGQQPAAQVPATPQVPEVQDPEVQDPEVRSAEPRPAAEPPDAARVPGPPLPQRTTSDQAQSQPAQSEQPRPTSTDFDVAEVRRQWRGVVDVIKRSSRATAALVETATPVVVRGGTLVINVPAALVRRLTDPQQQQPLKAALQDLLGVTWAIEVTDGAPQMQDQGGAPRVDGPPQDDDEDFAPDPEDETVAGPSGGLDPGQAAVSLLRDELDAQEIVEP